MNAIPALDGPGLDAEILRASGPILVDAAGLQARIALTWSASVDFCAR